MQGTIVGRALAGAALIIGVVLAVAVGSTGNAATLPPQPARAMGAAAAVPMQGGAIDFSTPQAATLQLGESFAAIAPAVAPDDANLRPGLLASLQIEMTPAPEPNVWAMMIAGMMMVGMRLRRERRQPRRRDLA